MTESTVETNPTRSVYFTHFLAELLGDTSPAASLVQAWVTMATLENNHAAWNPSSMTQPESGAEAYNSFGPGGNTHVWNYASAEQALSAFLKTLGYPEYAALRSVMARIQAAGDSPVSAGQTNLEVALAAIATSPWTGVTGDPTIYAGVTADDAIVEGPGGWPWWPADPPKTGTAPETEEQKVESAIDAQTATVEKDAKTDKVAAAKAKLAELKVHLAELEDILNKDA